MSNQTQRHHRRSIRLANYDYRSPGAYFVTICVQGGRCLLGDVVDGQMQLNSWGQIAHDCCRGIPEHFPHVQLDAYVVMPNHVHAIICILEEPSSHAVEAQHAALLQPEQGASAEPEHLKPRQLPRTSVESGSLGAIVRSFKAAVTQRINGLRGSRGAAFWQRNYWEHVVRTEASLEKIREYIDNNPALWEEDQLYPGAPPNPFNQWNVLPTGASCPRPGP